MKNFIIALILLFIQIGDIAAQDKKYSYDIIGLPPSQTMFTSFYINESNQIFVALNGGVYLPKDSLWFIPPANGHYFTSIAPNVKDTGLFVLANATDSTELYYLKTSVNGSIKKILLTKIGKGCYNLVYKNGLCCIWGYDLETSRIGILSSNGIEWLLAIKGIIRQVQVNDSSEVFFALNNSIYQLRNRRNILTINTAILGFDFDGEGNPIISCSEGIGLANDGKLNIVATGVAGLVQYKNENIFVLPPKGNKLYKFTVSNNGF